MINLDNVVSALARFEADTQGTEPYYRTADLRAYLRECLVEIRASRKADRVLLGSMSASITTGALASGDFDNSDADVIAVVDGSVNLARALLAKIDLLPEKAKTP